MAREFPGNTSPAGKPSIKSIATVAAKGALINPRACNGTEYKQERFGGGGKSAGPGAASRGKFSISPTPGTEYRQDSSRG